MPVSIKIELCLPRDVATVPLVRHMLRHTLQEYGVTGDCVADVGLALSEACANVVEHAYGPAGGTLTVQMELDGTTVVTNVRDNGRWRPARGENRGRGTSLIRACSDDMDVIAGVGGTTVTFRRHVTEAPQ